MHRRRRLGKGLVCNAVQRLQHEPLHRVQHRQINRPFVVTNVGRNARMTSAAVCGWAPGHSISTIVGGTSAIAASMNAVVPEGDAPQMAARALASTTNANQTLINRVRVKRRSKLAIIGTFFCRAGDRART